MCIFNKSDAHLFVYLSSELILLCGERRAAFLQLAEAAVSKSTAALSVLAKAKRELEQKHAVSILLMPDFNQALVWGEWCSSCQLAARDLGGLYKSIDNSSETEAPWKKGISHISASLPSSKDGESYQSEESNNVVEPQDLLRCAGSRAQSRVAGKLSTPPWKRGLQR
jgi:thiol-disulfide isomerase/thioredoxin